MLLDGRSDEFLRIASAHATERIVKRWGDHLPVWVGCGYPKSGTVWLCHLMSAYLGVPYPQNYRLPVAMRSVVHAHWDYDPRLSNVAYIHRDGRDIMVSYYFHQLREMKLARNPRAAEVTRRRFTHLFGPSFDPDDVRGNLPRFIEAEFTTRTRRHDSWADHVRSWCLPRRPGVAYVSYEELNSDPRTALGQLMHDLLGETPDPEKIALACARFDFSVMSGRAPGVEERGSFLRSGQSGDWKNYFDREAASVFDAHAGDLLTHLGYADELWVEHVAP